MTDAADELVRAATDPGYVPEPTPLADPWLERRQEGFGVSELGALYIALGLRTPAGGDPKYLLDAASRLFAVKARLRKPKAAGKAAAGGQARERDVLADWIDKGCPGADVTPWSVQHADELPKEYLPLVDRYCPRLTCTPDGFARDSEGRLVHVEIKTTWMRSDEKHMTGELWWAYRLQVLGGIAVTAAHSGVCVVGLGYASDDDGELAVFPVERDAEEIARIRGACVEGWKRVEAMRRKT